jgi:hypothetical protein
MGKEARSSGFNGLSNELSTTLISVSDQLPSLKNVRIVPIEVIVLSASVIIVFSPFSVFLS